jgi:hypothetical protein
VRGSDLEKMFDVPRVLNLGLLMFLNFIFVIKSMH